MRILATAAVVLTVVGNSFADGQGPFLELRPARSTFAWTGG